MKIKKLPLSKFVKINPEGITHSYPYQVIEYIDISSVGSGKLLEQPKEILLKDAPSRAKRIVRNKDIILATVRPNLRSFLFIKNPNDNTVVSTGFAVLRIKESFDPRYIYYAITDKRFTGYLTNNTKGTSYPAVDSDIVLRGDIPDFDFNRQKYIGEILSGYDDLIDTNRRRIQLLEKAARLLFREWFVYFRFPGHEKVKIVDGVPEGWKKTTLGNIANRIKKNYSINDEDLSLVDLARINSRTLAVTDVGVASDLETARIIFEIDDILFSSIRLYLHKVVLAPFRGITNTSVFVIRAKNPIYRAYITLLLFSDYAIQFANQHSTGTKMPVVKWGSVSKLPALIPHQTIMEDFQNMVWPMLEQIQLAYFQNQKLTKARDLLLPRLMSGEIEV